LLECCVDYDGDGYGEGPGCVGSDCDDTVADCNVDCETLAYQDADNDGYGNPAISHRACDAPPSYVLENTDCDDSDSDVNPGAVEICDGKDNDCDGQVDEGVCGETCADPIAIAGEVVYADDTSPYADDYTDITGECSLTCAGPDVVFSFTPTITGTWHFELVPELFDGVLYIASDCPNIVTSTMACSDESGEGVIETLDVDLESGYIYYVVVDGWTSYSAGPYTLTVTYTV
jgi:hypothetical protein